MCEQISWKQWELSDATTLIVLGNHAISQVCTTPIFPVACGRSAEICGGSGTAPKGGFCATFIAHSWLIKTDLRPIATIGLEFCHFWQFRHHNDHILYEIRCKRGLFWMPSWNVNRFFAPAARIWRSYSYVADLNLRLAVCDYFADIHSIFEISEIL